MKWIKINESNDNGMLTEEEFSKKYNKRECDKCCKKCQWFEPILYEDFGNCTHPEISKNEYPMSSIEYICDAFEPAM